MKVAVILEYVQDKEKLKATWAVHRVYLRGFLESGRLRAAGPFADESGALWVLEVDTIEEGEEIVRGDPFVAAGVCMSWKIRSFAYWSAQDSKGEAAR